LIEQRTFPTSLGVDPTSGYTSTYIQSGEDSHDFAFFPNDGILAIPYENGPIKLWDITQGNKLVHPISCCTWTQDMVLAFSSRLHPRLAIAHADTGIVLIWDLVTDTQIQTLHVMLPNTPTALVIYSVLLSPDGERLVTLKSDATLETWDVKTGDKLLILPGPTQTPDTTELDFSPDGKFLLIADCSGTQVVRDIATGAEIRRFSKRGCTFGAAFSADNKMIAMRGPETKVFSLETGEEVLSLPIRGGLVLFSPDGTRLIAGVGANASDPATVDVFMMQLNDLVALAKTRVTRGLTTAECQQYLHMEACLASP
jgi:WD40 repeat protein